VFTITPRLTDRTEFVALDTAPNAKTRHLEERPKQPRVQGSLDIGSRSPQFAWVNLDPDGGKRPEQRKAARAHVMRRACKERDQRRNTAQAAKIARQDQGYTADDVRPSSEEAGKTTSTGQLSQLAPSTISEGEATTLALLGYEELMPVSFRMPDLRARIGFPYSVDMDQIQYCKYARVA
jgi:hypothetical protein